MNVRVKICGITNLHDAMAAVEAGADALGFVFCEESPRRVDVKTAAEIIGQLPPFVARVGLFVNAPEDSIRQTAERCRLDTLQLHGDEAPEFCQRFRLSVIKAFRVRDESSLAALKSYAVSGFLLDAFVAGKLGGTGERFDWALARQAAETCPRVILAGGLTPENVALAVRQVRPYAVDVSSGVESKPGQKDHSKLVAFIQAAKSAEELSCPGL
jgi:phosphoribosylanthranilate isomerase